MVLEKQSPFEKERCFMKFLFLVLISLQVQATPTFDSTITVLDAKAHTNLQVLEDLVADAVNEKHCHSIVAKFDLSESMEELYFDRCEDRMY